MQLLAKDPQRRPASAAAVSGVLQGAAEPPAVKPASTVPSRFRRYRWLGVVFLLASPLLVAIPMLRSGGRRAPIERGTLCIEAADSCAAITFHGERTRVVDPVTKREFE